MARPKVIRKAEEAKDIDPSLPIQVELSPEGEVTLSPDQQAEADKLLAEQEAAKQAAAAEKEQDDEVVTLKQQLEDLKKTSDFFKQQAEEAGKREAEARKRADTSDGELKTMGTRAEQAEYDAIVNAISAVTSEGERAEEQLKIAGEAQDWAAIAKAQAALSRASTRLVQLEDGKATLEARAERAKEAAKNPPPPAGDPIENHINSIPNLMPAQRKWLNEHRDLMTDSKKNIRLQNAHIDAEEAGHAPGSDGYFKFLEERLGYRKVEAPARDIEDDDNDTNQRPPIVSAPPSRDPPSSGTGKPTPTRITLTAEQRSAAQAAGVDEITYARQLLKLQELKKIGHYNEH